MHLAARLHVVINLDRMRFIAHKHSANFVQRPSEIVAVVLERLIGILTGVEPAALAVRKDICNPLNDPFGRLAEQGVSRHLIAMQEILQQLRIVVRHFLEVRHAPAFVHRIAVKSAG
jgi:hypothetical protein